jgi:hypothetical protein
VWYDNSYSRDYFPVGSNCTGAAGGNVSARQLLVGAPIFAASNIPLKTCVALSFQMLFDESINTSLDELISKIDPANLPLDKDCKPVYPHMYLKVSASLSLCIHSSYTANMHCMHIHSSTVVSTLTLCAVCIVLALLCLPQTNTIFEVAHEAGLASGWSDKHPAYDIVNGPSGAGVDDLFTPEINSITPADNGKDYTNTVEWTMYYDR